MPASGVRTHVPSPSTSLSQGQDGAEKKVMCELGGEKKLDVHLGVFWKLVQPFGDGASVEKVRSGAKFDSQAHFLSALCLLKVDSGPHT